MRFGATVASWELYPPLRAPGTPADLLQPCQLDLRVKGAVNAVGDLASDLKSQSAHLQPHLNIQPARSRALNIPHKRGCPDYFTGRFKFIQSRCRTSSVSNFCTETFTLESRPHSPCFCSNWWMSVLVSCSSVSVSPSRSGSTPVGDCDGDWERCGRFCD